MHRHLVKFLLVVTLCSGVTISFFGQSKIKTRLLHSDTSSFQFTSEWQYLSTDVYLFNAKKFPNLINELDFTKEQKGGLFSFKKESNEFLEYLYITASLKNVRFFDKQEITYPLYNFRVDREKDNRYRTYISDDIDHIRIIDNLPLYSAQDFIDAEIDVHAITNNSGDQVMNMIAKQLKNIANITNPSTAVMSLVGELGNFMESSSRRKEYKFRSTIRLYEKKNFDSRIHSIKIYAMVTDNSENYKADNQGVKSYLMDLSNRSIDRKTLDRLIEFKKYPYLVVVNYKSLYRMDAVSGDEITFSTIEERKIQIENDYNSGLINEDTYRLEKDFLNFLTVFANLKKTLEMYNLNFKTGNSDAISNSLFNIVQYYRQLLETYRHNKFKYRQNSTFERIFEPEYESIIGYAGIYLEKDHYLTNCRNLAETNLKLDTLNIERLDSAAIEKYLNHLHFTDEFNSQHLKEVPEGETILQQIKKLEKTYFRREFERCIEQVEQLDGSEQKPKVVNQLRKDARKTHCGLCKDSSFSTLSEYERLRNEYKKRVALQKFDSVRNESEHSIFDLWSRIDKIRYNFDKIYGQDSTRSAVDIIQRKLKITEEKAKALQNLLKKPKEQLKQEKIEKINSFRTKISNHRHSILDNLNFICAYNEQLCQEKAVLQKKNREQEKLAEAYNKYILKTEETISELNQLIDSCVGKDTLSESVENAAVYEKRIKLMKNRISVIQSRIENPPDNADDKYHKKINQLKKEYSKLQKLISFWCQQSPAFCFFLEAFGN